MKETVFLCLDNTTVQGAFVLAEKGWQEVHYGYLRSNAAAGEGPRRKVASGRISRFSHTRMDQHQRKSA
eukprot:9771407-Lingulodinium_polyedra.AAC.1